jgi:16S rRNA (cytidine1402-2'-O)-methyltransferase
VSIKAGILYVVATPIGNLGDMTSRAREVLAAVDCIAAEDTRHSGRLLAHFQIDTPTLALHEHNERDLAPRLVERLAAGESIALISDAGTPLVSDPGFHLVRLARERGIQVVPVPGASAAMAALSVSGLPSDRFVFEGFLSPKAGTRKQRLQALAGESRTLIFYEAPHRILDTLADMVAVLGGQRRAVMARELTKTFETIKDDTLDALLVWVRTDPHQQKGEIVLLVEGAGTGETTAGDAEALRILRLLMEEMPLSQASALAAKITGLKKKPLYQLGLTLTKDKP